MLLNLNPNNFLPTRFTTNSRKSLKKINSINIILILKIQLLPLDQRNKKKLDIKINFEHFRTKIILD